MLQDFYITWATQQLLIECVSENLIRNLFTLQRLFKSGTGYLTYYEGFPNMKILHLLEILRKKNKKMFIYSPQFVSYCF